MKTKEIKLYEFAELSEDIKKNVIERNNDINVDHEWYDFIYEEFTEQAKNAGFDVEKIYFSGFSSQGDGAMFEYSFEGNKLVFDFIDSIKLSEMRKGWLKKWVDYSGKGKQSGHHYHERSCSHSIEFCPIFNYSRAINVNNWIELFASDFEEYVIDIYIDLCKGLYKSLEKEYEYLTSEEAIIETIEANEYFFTEQGRIES